MSHWINDFYGRKKLLFRKLPQSSHCARLTCWDMCQQLKSNKTAFFLFPHLTFAPTGKRVSGPGTSGSRIFQCLPPPSPQFKQQKTKFVRVLHSFSLLQVSNHVAIQSQQMRQCFIAPKSPVSTLSN